MDPSQPVYRDYAFQSAAPPHSLYQPTFPGPPPLAHQQQLPQQLPQQQQQGNGQPSRKRPKYTRSKAGCLTCRTKKIKCDELKPVCTRCLQSHRECTWPPDQPSPRRSKTSTAPSTPSLASKRVHPYGANPLGHRRNISLEGHLVGGGSHGNSDSGSPGSSGSNTGSSARAMASLMASPAISSGASTGGRGSGASPSFPNLQPVPNNSYLDPNLLPLLNAMFPTAPLTPSPALSSGSPSFSPSMPALPPAPPTPPTTGDPTTSTFPYLLPSPQIHDSALKFPGADGGWWDASALLAGMGADPNSPTSPSDPNSNDPNNPNARASTALTATNGISPNNSSTALTYSFPSSSPIAEFPASLSAFSPTELDPTFLAQLSQLQQTYGSPTTETSVGMGQWGGTTMAQPLIAGPDPFEPYFQTVEERNLIRHYCNTATKIIMAVPSDLNPVLAINLPLVFEHPPGQNPATEALRLSLLGVGAIHQAYLLSRHGVSSASQQEMMNLAMTLRLTATHYLRVACCSAQGMESDAALGASITIALIDIFTGGQNWTANLALAKTLVDLRGGPRAIIAQNQPHLIDGGAKVSPARLLLEILAVYDTFGSLTTGEPPSILGPGSEDWWFDGDKHSYHLFSVEKVFGMSRAMIELVARVSCLASRATRHRGKIVEIPEEEEAEEDREDGAAIEAEALALYEEAKSWTDPALRYRLHPRVENGNCAHRQAMQIVLLRDVLRVGRKDERVQAAAANILKLCSESAKRLGMAVDLTWPTIVAGCQVEPQDRDAVLKTFEGFREQCCFDIDTAERIVQEVWNRVDADEDDPRADWRSVTEDLDLKVLLL